MPGSIDPAKLKASAEHLEWVLRQYPDSSNVQALLGALLPIIEDAKNESAVSPTEAIPCRYQFSDGLYQPYKDPDVDSAYVEFRIQMRGGLTEDELELRADTGGLLRSLRESNRSQAGRA